MSAATDTSILADTIMDLVGARALAQVRVTSTDHGLTRFANSHIHQHVGEQTTDIVLSLVRDGRSVSLSTTRVEHLPDLVDRALDLAAAAPVDPTFPGLAPADEPTSVDRTDPATVAATPDDRAAIVEAFVGAGQGLNAAGYCETVVTDVAYANSTGRRRRATTTRATLDGIHRTDTSSGSGHATSRSIGDLDGGTIGANARLRARRGVDPQDLDPGEYEVVLGSEPVATLMIFLSLYAFNARAVDEQRSAVTLGAEQFDPLISLRDDVTDPRSVGLPFDMEGTDRPRLELVTSGRVTALTHNRRTAATAGTSSTGHHVPGSDTMGPVADSLVLGDGATKPGNLVRSVERGVYITAFNYCRVLDPKTLVVTGLTRNGTFLIEDGAITKPLGNLRFTQSFTGALAPGAVLGVGTDARYADSEFGPGMTIAPSLRLASWNVTGNQQG